MSPVDVITTIGTVVPGIAAVASIAFFRQSLVRSIQTDRRLEVVLRENLNSVLRNRDIEPEVDDYDDDLDIDRDGDGDEDGSVVRAESFGPILFKGINRYEQARKLIPENKSFEYVDAELRRVLDSAPPTRKATSFVLGAAIAVLFVLTYFAFSNFYQLYADFQLTAVGVSLVFSAVILISVIYKFYRSFRSIEPTAGRVASLVNVYLALPEIGRRADRKEKIEQSISYLNSYGFYEIAADIQSSYLAIVDEPARTNSDALQIER